VLLLDFAISSRAAVSLNIYIYIYIYGERGREGEIEREILKMENTCFTVFF
jgi:hypothetical protein